MGAGQGRRLLAGVALASLEPIFAQLRPHVGYRCLAALARSRRVVVINLNWDPLVTMACDLLNVPWVAYDIGDRAQWDASATLPNKSESKQPGSRRRLSKGR